MDQLDVQDPHIELSTCVLENIEINLSYLTNY